MAKLEWNSKEDWDANKGEFALLPTDDYKLEVVKVEEKSQNKYMSEEMEDVVNVTLEVISFKDGGEVLDSNGAPVGEKLVFFTIRPKSMGWMRDGTPSKSRAFVAQAIGVGTDESLSLDSWEDLLGKIVYAEIVEYEKKSGGGKANKISRIVAPPRN